MRKITLSQILYFQILLWSAIGCGISTVQLLLGSLPLGDFRGIVLTLSSIVFIYLFAFLIYRVFLHYRPLKEGYLPEGSREEFTAQVHSLFYLLIFNSLIRTHFLPIPLMRLVYIALGAKLGKNTYSAGAILDPPLTEVGDNTIIGHDAALFSHAIEGRYFSLNTIRIGNNVTIGATAVIMPDVIIGDGAIVSAGAVVSKGTRIAPGEIWGGLPAKLIKHDNS
ncbi:MAG: acyltransferase [Gammaproteobacteria bacterium]|nr:acyltransferase [Gammaproteobacteria bacterium]